MSDMMVQLAKLDAVMEGLQARAEKAEKERDAAIHDRNEAKAKVDAFRSIADSAGKAAEAMRVRLREVEAELAEAQTTIENLRDPAQPSRPYFATHPVCPSCEGPLTCARCTVSDQVLAEAERLDARRIDDLERKFAEHDTVFVNESERHRHEKHETRIRDLERAVEELKDGKSPSPFGPRYAGHCSDCGIGPAGAHLAGCSKGQPL